MPHRRIYIACPRAHTDRALAFASSVRLLGMEVASTWHDTAPADAPEPTDRDEARAILARNCADLLSADVLVALLCDMHGRETYVELGRWLALRCGPTLLVTRGAVPLSWAQDGVDVVPDVATACRALAGLASMRSALDSYREGVAS